MAWQDKPIEAIGGGILSYFDELKDMLGKNKKKKGIEVGGGIMDALGIGERALGSEQETTAFQEKMNWLKNNPNASNYELQLLGITPEVKSAFQEKMNWLGQNPDATQEELGVLGIGTRALNTPAERDWLKKVMSGGGAGSGVTDEYRSGVTDKMKFVAETLKNMGVQEGSPQFRQMMLQSLSNSGFDAGGNYRDKVNMFAPQEEYSSQVMKFLTSRALDAGLQPGTPAFRDFIMNSGGSDIGSRGLATAAEKDFLADSFVGGSQNKLLDNWQGKATAQASDTNQQMFENKLNQLDQGQLDQVMKVMSPMTTEQKERFVNDVINGQVSLTGYGIQDEANPGELTPNFAGEGMQYNTGTTLPNLGFAGY
tara:strand:+ start:1446 stop:2549 length:1104 start_codon:yes stop_codon:yes gene_type:complete